MNIVYYLAGAIVPTIIYWFVTRYSWHSRFHTNGPVYLLGGRAICNHCVREWLICPDCKDAYDTPCLCRAREEAQLRLTELRKRG